MRTAISASLLRRPWAVGFAVAALAATAACSDDQVTAPTTAREVSAPNATIAPRLGQQVTVQFKDINGNLIIAGMIPSEWLSMNAAGDTTADKVRYDNQFYSDGDQNNVLGVMTMNMPFAAKQRVCLYTFPEDYAYDILQPTPCNEASVTTYKVDLGTLVLRKKPRHTFFFKDASSALIAGATIHVTGPFGYDKTFVDGGAGDLVADGKILLKTDQPGQYRWCEVTAPGGFNLTSPTCGIVNMFWEENTTQSLYHTKKVRAII
jgi:hypothetical protein